MSLNMFMNFHKEVKLNGVVHTPYKYVISHHSNRLSTSNPLKHPRNSATSVTLVVLQSRAAIVANSRIIPQRRHRERFVYTRKEILRILNGAITEGNDDLWKVYVWDGNVDGFVPEVGGKRGAQSTGL